MPDTLTSTETPSNRRPTKARHGKSVRELWSNYQQAWKNYSDAIDADDAARVQIRPHLPPRPACLVRTMNLTGGGTNDFNVDLLLIRNLVEWGHITESEAGVLRGELRQWEVACMAVEYLHGRPKAQAALDAAEKAFRNVERAFIKAPVRSMEGAVSGLLLVLDQQNLDEASERVLRASIRTLQKLN